MPLFWAGLVGFVWGVVGAARGADLWEQVLPVLRERCVECHGGKRTKGGLRMDSRAGLLKGGEGGPAIVLGHGKMSRLMERVLSDDEDVQMPPKGERLTTEQVAALRAWIDAGAVWPDDATEGVPATAQPHWALLPVRRPPLIERERAIDHFVHARLAEYGVHVAVEADRRTLVRRLTLDLTGLAPRPDEVERFVTDRDPKSYERLVDRLLASPQYGERQAQHWLDVVRFTESDGFEEDMQRKNAWTYRDYVIQAFNEDVPYDRFVREQIAGDVMEPVTSRTIAATGFLVAGAWDALQRVTPSPLGRLQSREEELEEMVGAVGQTFLGLTVQCARCHDHKFDPVLQREYYAMKAVFEGVDHGLVAKRHGERRMLSREEDARWEVGTKPLRESVMGLDRRLSEIEKELKAKDLADERKVALLSERGDVEAKRGKAKQELELRYPVTMAFIGDREQPRPTVLFRRGDVRQPGEVVRPGGLTALSPLSPDLGLEPDALEGERRIRFARWLTDRANPLTARVMVNRIWQQHFGTGIVDTPSDLGVNGGRPSHPELLDWLASEFVERGWSVKAMHRLIVLSATYRSTSSAEVGHEGKAPASFDVENRLLWHFPTRRLEGEVVNDSMLLMSGSLNGQMGGPSFAPFTVTRLNTYFYHLFDKDDPTFNRRSIYRFHVITARSPLLDALDCPSPGVASPRRRPTTTPVQALALMNDPFVKRQADTLAQRIMADQAVGDSVDAAFRMVLSRPPRPDELRACGQVFRDHGLGTVCWSLFNSSEFLYLP